MQLVKESVVCDSEVFLEPNTEQPVQEQLTDQICWKEQPQLTNFDNE